MAVGSIQEWEGNGLAEEGQHHTAAVGPGNNGTPAAAEEAPRRNGDDKRAVQEGGQAAARIVVGKLHGGMNAEGVEGEEYLSSMSAAAGTTEDIEAAHREVAGHTGAADAEDTAHQMECIGRTAAAAAEGEDSLQHKTEVADILAASMPGGKAPEGEALEAEAVEAEAVEAADRVGGRT